MKIVNMHSTNQPKEQKCSIARRMNHNHEINYFMYSKSK